MSASVSSLYSSMDVGEIKQDRLAINQKLQRHQSSRRMSVPHHDEQDRLAINQKIRQHQSSRGNVGTQYQGHQEERVNTQPNSRRNLPSHDTNAGSSPYLPDDFLEEDNDDASLALMQSALHRDSQGNFMPITRSSVNVIDKGDGYLEVEMGRKRRHSTNNSPIIDIPPSLPQVFVDLPSVMRSQNKEKSEASFLYILLCLALLVSYAFFLESCKLMNYGT